nr:MAG TPA: hypothetical protein [Caudoviricetes sp.]
MKSKIISVVPSMTLNCFALNIRASTRRGWITNKSELESEMNPCYNIPNQTHNQRKGI